MANNIQRLLDFIDDDSERRNAERLIQTKISEFDMTILTNTYEDSGQHILQLSTYADGQLYGGEVVLTAPDGELNDTINVQVSNGIIDRKI